MFSTRNEIIAQFRSPVFIPHRRFAGMETFSRLSDWTGKNTILVELPRLKIAVHSIDYLRNIHMPAGEMNSILRFQQNCYRLWYQVDGQGVLHNATRNIFGTAKPGLLGLMEIGERYTYLHQKGPFECFLLEFSILPSQQAKCYWNSEAEGKLVLPENNRLYFENLIFDLIRVIANDKEILGLASISRILEILVVLFTKGLLVIKESQFPKNKAKSLVEKAKSFMNLHYAKLHHQKDLEKECGVDINYLNMLFNKQTGKTLYTYLSDIRMEHAKFLLEENKLPINEIASHVGYPNGNSFARAFKRSINQTPTSYQKKSRRQGIGV
jgi:AraC-type DNA-binding domain-containing proteins